MKNCKHQRKFDDVTINVHFLKVKTAAPQNSQFVYTFLYNVKACMRNYFKLAPFDFKITMLFATGIMFHNVRDVHI